MHLEMYSLWKSAVKFTFVSFTNKNQTFLFLFYQLKVAVYFHRAINCLIIKQIPIIYRHRHL